MLLAANDPIIVLTEPFDLSTWQDTVNETSVTPWLWKNSGEYQWHLGTSDWNTTVGDLNGYADDAYGWNFSADSPSVVATSALHGATIMSKVLALLQHEGTPQNVRVRIMHVIGPGDEVAAYIVQQKNLDANIVAVSDSSTATVFTREDIELLGDNEILYLDVQPDHDWLLERHHCR